MSKIDVVRAAMVEAMKAKKKSNRPGRHTSWLRRTGTISVRRQKLAWLFIRILHRKT